MSKEAIFIMGPTAVGKTALAMQLSQYLPVDIISVDSAMVYRGMDIGTGKPTAAELCQFPHQLIDICDPSQPYSAAQFCIDATKAMQDSWQKQRIPLLVGGTMLYFKALQFGLAELPNANPILREKLLAELHDKGLLALHRRLHMLDPGAAQRLNINDTQRILRALEINILTGKTLAQNYQAQTKPSLDYKLHSFAIVPHTRTELHNQIAIRFEKMLHDGFIEEVEKLHNRSDLHANLPSMRSVGYRQVWSYLEQEIDFIKMRDNAIAATRQLAKRQLTWLRSWPKVITIENSGSAALDTLIKSVLHSRED